MKKIVLFILAISLIDVCFGQNSPQSEGEFHPAISKVKLQPYLPSSSMLLMSMGNSKSEAYHYEGEHAIDKCNSYRKMKIAGIILSAVGGGMIVTGAIMRGTAVARNTNGDITYNDYWGLMNGGGAMVGLGVLSAGAGIPLAIIGSVKTRRYCRGGSAY